jgi:hypothetical protein
LIDGLRWLQLQTSTTVGGATLGGSLWLYWTGQVSTIALPANPTASAVGTTDIVCQRVRAVCVRPLRECMCVAAKSAATAVLYAGLRISAECLQRRVLRREHLCL